MPFLSLLRSTFLALCLSSISFLHISSAEDYTQTDENSTFFYFAYGSNLLAKRIHINNPTAILYGIGHIDEHRIDFGLPMASWNGAVSTIVPEPNSEVWGTLWTINTTEMANLDRQEGVDRGWYVAKNVTVTTNNNETVVARTYQFAKLPDKVDELPENRRPSNTYLMTIYLGAHESGLSNNYIRYLQSFRTNGLMAPCTKRSALGYPFDVGC